MCYIHIKTYFKSLIFLALRNLPERCLHKLAPGRGAELGQLLLDFRKFPHLKYDQVLYK